MDINHPTAIEGAIITASATVGVWFGTQILTYLKSMNKGITDIKEMAIEHKVTLQSHGERLDTHERRIEKVEDHLFKN